MPWAGGFFSTYNPFAPPIFAASPATGVPNPALGGRVPGASYNTALSPLDEFAFRKWVSGNNIPFDPNSTAPQDYDMRGYWQGLQQQNPKATTGLDPNDNKVHFTDYWKTPLHQSFSGESQWSPANGPQWTENDQLAAPSGRVIYDDRAPRGGLLSMLGMK